MMTGSAKLPKKLKPPTTAERVTRLEAMVEQLERATALRKPKIEDNTSE